MQGETIINNNANMILSLYFPHTEQHNTNALFRCCVYTYSRG
nr:MAG TPA: hypothetical protein [Caudoviricetes sp.]